MFRHIFYLFSLALCLTPSREPIRTTSVPTDVRSVVVELFTSEGCSSCPAADRAVARLAAEHEQNVLVLCYHVDYWNRLGWKDVFSDPAFSARQRQYAGRFGLQSVYTPQAVVNGSQQMVGSDERGLARAVQSGLSSAESAELRSTAQRNGDSVDVRFSTDQSSGTLLQFALIQPEASTKVTGGENGGRTLHHINIVRSLISVEAKPAGSVRVAVPSALAGSAFDLIVFIQQKSSMHILAANRHRIG